MERLTCSIYRVTLACPPTRVQTLGGNGMCGQIFGENEEYLIFGKRRRNIITSHHFEKSLYLTRL